MNVRKVPKQNLPFVISEPWVDASRRPYCREECAYVPVREGFPYDEELPERLPYQGTGYQKMGDTLLLHGRVPDDAELHDLIRWEQPACILHAENHAGVLRIPQVRVLYGTPHEVTFREAGITYTLHPAKVMFSQGNRGEKQRLRTLIRPGERICDMFAGIGYFTLPAAAAGACVHAIELNPDSYEYLCRNIRDNHLEHRVTPVLGDCRDHISGVYDRILMGHFEAVQFLDTALAHAGAGTVLHVHGLGDCREPICTAVEKAGFTYTLSEHKIKKYAAHVWHCVWDVTLG